MTAWDVLGYTGHALFFSRFLVQWLASERAKRSVAPPSFWWLSLAGTLLFVIHTWGAGQGLLLTVFVVNFVIYARNIALSARAARAISPPLATALVVAACVSLWIAGELLPDRLKLDRAPGPWFWVGSISAVLWGGRFLLQWWYAERHGLSHFPISFWWVSLVGNAGMLAYTLHLGEPIYIIGFVIGPFVQVRNLVLEYRRRARESDAPHDDSPMPEREILPAPRETPARVDQAPPSRRK